MLEMGGRWVYTVTMEEEVGKGPSLDEYARDGKGGGCTHITTDSSQELAVIGSISTGSSHDTTIGFISAVGQKAFAEAGRPSTCDPTSVLINIYRVGHMPRLCK